MFFFFNDTATTEIYTLSLHDALPIFNGGVSIITRASSFTLSDALPPALTLPASPIIEATGPTGAVASFNVSRSEEHTLNSSHANISYAVFCLKKKQSNSIFISYTTN